jgi:small conductance mechanosensitive channel
MPEMPSSVTSAWDQVVVIATTYGLDVLGGIVLLIIGWTAAGWAARGVDAGLARLQRFDLTLRRFIASLVRYLILTVTVLAVLSKFGVQTTGLIAVFGAAGLAVGLALQGTLSNLAAGVMILLFRPFKIGDSINAGGAAGTVEHIDLFTTELRSPDNVQHIVPNGRIWGAPVTNYSVHATRRVDLKLVVDHSFDLDQAIGTIRETLARDPRTRSDPPPSVTVSEVGEAATTLMAYAWCMAADHDELKVGVMKNLKSAMKTTLKSVSG